jgi:hypothetical protein
MVDFPAWFCFAQNMHCQCIYGKQKMEAVMTKKNSTALIAAALVAFAAPAIAAPHSSADLSAAFAVMALGNPHPVRQIASADEAAFDSKQTEDRRNAELSNWE